MKSIVSLFAFVLMIVSGTAFAQEKTENIKVFGNCGMCKNRIEKNLKMEGITVAKWDIDTKILTVTYNPAQISNDDIQKKVASVGHDTEKFSAPDEVYNKLHGCCKYDRKKE